MRDKADVRQVIKAVKAKLAEIGPTLPSGVSVRVVYDRSAFIDRAIATLHEELLKEIVVVALVCIVFLLHLRSALVPIAILPIAILASFCVMYLQGISSNIMSLSGIAIAIGTMVDAAIVMVENAHKHYERDFTTGKTHWEIIRDAATEVGPTIFFTLLVITVSFLPIFALEGQEGRLFKPLAFTKTYAMAWAALLSVTLAPVLMGYAVSGKIVSEERNVISQFLIRVYRPLLGGVLRFPRMVVTAALLVTLSAFFPWNKWVVAHLPDGKLRQLAQKLGVLFPLQNLGSEFMPPLYEGDLLYMPTTLPGISPTKARELLQQTNKIIMSFGEVATAFGKIGRAESATDPAPLDMVETTIMLKNQSEWPVVEIRDPESGKIIARRRRTPDELIAALDRALQIPGVTNAWTMPIRARIDMLATGFRTPVGIKVAGPDLRTLERIGESLESVIRGVPGTSSVYSERVMQGNYIEIDIARDMITRYGLTIADVQEAVELALGGMPLTMTVEGLERYAVILRYARDYREWIEDFERILIPTPSGAKIPLGTVAKIRTVSGPMAIKSEGAIPNVWVYVDVHGVDLGTYLRRAQNAVKTAIANGEISLPQGYSLIWSGQYEHMQRARERLLIIVPVTLFLILVILYFNTRSWTKTAIVILAVPFSLV